MLCFEKMMIIFMRKASATQPLPWIWELTPQHSCARLLSYQVWSGNTHRERNGVGLFY